MLTVAQLIAKLSDLPQDAYVMCEEPDGSLYKVESEEKEQIHTNMIIYKENESVFISYCSTADNQPKDSTIIKKDVAIVILPIDRTS